MLVTTFAGWTPEQLLDPLTKVSFNQLRRMLRKHTRLFEMCFGEYRNICSKNSIACSTISNSCSTQTNHFNNCSSMECFGALQETKDSAHDNFFVTSWGKLIFIFLGVVLLMFLDFCCERRCFLRCFRENRTYGNGQDHDH